MCKGGDFQNKHWFEQAGLKLDLVASFMFQVKKTLENVHV